MLPLLGVGSIFERTVLAYVADKTGNLNVLTLCTIVSALFGFCWIAVNGVAGVKVWTIFCGIFSGAFVSMQVPTVVRIFIDLKIIGGRTGTNNLCCALGKCPPGIAFLERVLNLCQSLLIGNPIGGVILKRSWIGLQVFCGAMLVASAVGIVFTLIKVVGMGLATKLDAPLDIRPTLLPQAYIPVTLGHSHFAPFA